MANAGKMKIDPGLSVAVHFIKYETSVLDGAVTVVALKRVGVLIASADVLTDATTDDAPAVVNVNRSIVQKFVPLFVVKTSTVTKNANGTLFHGCGVSPHTLPELASGNGLRMRCDHGK